MDVPAQNTTAIEDAFICYAIAIIINAIAASLVPIRRFRHTHTSIDRPCIEQIQSDTRPVQHNWLGQLEV